MRRTVLHVVGARPNFMKVAPLLLAASQRSGHEHLLVHTGQHYDETLNDAIFRDLALRAPDVHLGVGSGTHAEQTGRIMVAFEPVVRERRPSLVVVAGDVNSTLACSVVAAKAGVPIAHLEAGLRSNDWAMPEEINRLVTDRLTSLFLTPSADADENLRREGVPSTAIVRVGNLMVDTLVRNLERARRGDALARFGVSRGGFILTTLHRPSNVDDEQTLQGLIEVLATLAEDVPVIFPMHPRTRARLASNGSIRKITMVEPLGYLDFLQLEDAARVVLTDSGGVQEETTALGVPCLTMRENTERPVTVTEGTNKVIGSDPRRVLAETREVLRRKHPLSRVPDLWDGRAAQRAIDAIERFLENPRLPSAWSSGA